MSILIVEDNLVLARNVAAYLATEGFSCECSAHGDDGLRLALESSYACILLDLNLPGTDGVSVCVRLRAAGIETPIIMLTARTGSEQAVTGLNAGADDYLEKPFQLAELVARIRAVLRRQGTERAPLIRIGALELDTNVRSVTKEGRYVSLSPKEYALVEFLARNRGVAQSRVAILESVWDDDPDLVFSQTVDVHVAYVRKKLGKQIIVTVPRVGYLIP